MKNYNDTNFITGLRFLAVLLVFFAHINSTGIFDDYPMLKPLYYMGKYGVDIFFVISGFTIYAQLSRFNMTIRQFLYARVARISVVYWPFLTLVLIYYWYGNGVPLTGWYEKEVNSSGFVSVLVHFLFLGSIYPKFANNLIGVEWSLSIEMFYYVSLSALYFLCFVNNLYKLAFLFVLVIFISVGSSVFRGTIGIEDYTFLWLPFKYGYMFVLGGGAYYIRCLVNDLLDKKTNCWLSDVVVFLSVSVLYLMVFYEMYLYSSFIVSFIVAMLTFFVLVFLKQGALFDFPINNSIFIFFGSFSFSFYLVHNPVLTICGFLYPELEPVGLVAFGFLLSCIVSYLWYLVFERYFYNKIKGITCGR